MSNALLEYLNNRLGEQKANVNRKKTHGPLITISREVGCNGVKLAIKMAENFNQENVDVQWKVLSKEIFLESAKELNMEPEQVKRVFKFDSYTFNEILNAFGTRKYKSDKKVVRTVIEIIRSFAENGYCIIVGRAANIIAHDIKNSLHLRLVAPLEYRIKTIMTNNYLNREEAIDFINRVERERASFRRAIKKEALEADGFDLGLNRASFQDEDVIELIKLAAQKKNIFKTSIQTANRY